MSASQSSCARLNKAVREASLWSVAWLRPPVRFQTSQVSTVPAASSPLSARAFTPGTFSTSHASLPALKKESLKRPVRCRTSWSSPSAFQRATMSSVCFDIHMMAG